MMQIKIHNSSCSTFLGSSSGSISCTNHSNDLQFKLFFNFKRSLKSPAFTFFASECCIDKESKRETFKEK
ncbi:hypothetical protein X798_06815, partial [Onchocerca flexuosa]